MEEKKKPALTNRKSFIDLLRSPRASRKFDEVDWKEHKVKSGNLKKKGGKGLLQKIRNGQGSNWQTRLFILTNTKKLYYFSNAISQPKGCIDLSNYVIENYLETRKTFAFKLVPQRAIENEPPRSWYFCCESQEDKENWIIAINSIITGKQQNRRSVEMDEKLRRSNLSLRSNEVEVEFDDASELGRGSTGTVKKGKYLGSPVAIKILHISPESVDSDELKQFYKEMSILSEMRYESIVTMFGYCRKNEFLCLVTEYVPGGTLATVIKSGIEYDPISLAIPIVCGMRYLHSKGVIHRDLKPLNVLVEDLALAKLKICDFGLSHHAAVCSSSEFNGNAFSPAYLAPELSSPDHTELVDVFSFGVLFWEMQVKQDPWPDCKSAVEIFQKVKKGERNKIPSYVKGGSLISKCWSTSPFLRPEFSAIYEELMFLRTQFIATNELQLSQPFETKDSIPWDEFSKLWTKTFLINLDLHWEVEFLQSFRFVLESAGFVTKQKWKAFLKWFPRIVAQVSEYNNFDRNAVELPQKSSECIWSLQHIHKLISDEWFYGFKSADILLRHKPTGTFLIRFSSQPGYYTLSVVVDGTIVHWRITCEKNESVAPVVTLDNEAKYLSFTELVQAHQRIPLALKDPNGTEMRLILLGEGCNRDIETVEEEMQLE